MQFDSTERTKAEALRDDIDAAWRQAKAGDFAKFDPQQVAAELDRNLESGA